MAETEVAQKKAEGNGAMAGLAAAGQHLGLDMGTSRLVLAEMKGKDPTYNVQLNAFVSMPHTKMSQSMLEREGIIHFVEDSQILVFGNRADEFANILGGATRRPMDTGLLNPKEPKNLQIMEFAVEKLCGRAKKGASVCFSVPSARPGGEAELTYHERSVARILEGLGYRAKSINEGLAVVYAELKDSNFTGIGMSFGGGLCNVCISYLGLPVETFCTTKAGDFIDGSAASVTGETPTTVRFHKESTDFTVHGQACEKSVDRALSVFYRDIVEATAAQLETVLNETKKMPKLTEPVPIVFSGGTSMVKGFKNELKMALRDKRFPIEISEIRQAKSTLNATAKGALLSAMLNM